MPVGGWAVVGANTTLKLPKILPTRACSRGSAARARRSAQPARRRPVRIFVTVRGSQCAPASSRSRHGSSPAVARGRKFRPSPTP
ncbi:Uncharacterised protein [Mycobacteroides abscessus subsp. abscessus]|nr:Uncharacterised protein [Mycobacteroides abscessus subsp. abscessus]